MSPRPRDNKVQEGGAKWNTARARGTPQRSISAINSTATHSSAEACY